MVYFNENLVQIPRHFDENPSKMVLINEVTSDKTEIDVVNISTDPRMYVFDFQSITLNDGTYKYSLGSEVGLFQVGDYVSTTLQYNERSNKVVYER